jgi:RHS repeat-associated protein
VYEHIEYTPYGELWLEQGSVTGKTPFRFTRKELDKETGLYYYGARYLNPQTSMWLSADPAMGEYIPRAPIDDEAKRYNGNLPGMGGVYNYVNLHSYHYAGNNPVKLSDPDGREEKPGLEDYVETGRKVFDLGLAIRSDLGKDPSDISQSDLMKRVDQMNEIVDAIGKSPIQYAGYTSALGVLGAIGYNMYKNDKKINGLVNSAINKVVKANDFFKSNGIDLGGRTYTFVKSSSGEIKMKLGGAVSRENVSLTADNIFSIRFSSSTTLSAQFGLGVNVPLDPGSFKPDFGNMTPVNLGWKIHFTSRF